MNRLLALVRGALLRPSRAPSLLGMPVRGFSGKPKTAITLPRSRALSSATISRYRELTDDDVLDADLPEVRIIPGEASHGIPGELSRYRQVLRFTRVFLVNTNFIRALPWEETNFRMNDPSGVFANNFLRYMAWSLIFL